MPHNYNSPIRFDRPLTEQNNCNLPETGCLSQTPDPQIPITIALVNTIQKLADQDSAKGYDLACLAKENERIKACLERRQAEINAYNEVLSRNGSTLVLDNTGRLVELLNRQIDVALRILPEAPSPQESFYLVTLKGESTSIRLSEMEFFRDSILIQRLQEIPGVQVSPRRSMKQTAFLLRKAMAVETLRVPFYAGWSKNESGTCDFQLFPDGSTHRAEQQYTFPTPLNTSPFPKESICHFHQILDSVNNSNCRQLLRTWFHASALTSLLSNFGFSLPLFLCLSSPVGIAADWAKTFFGWFGDPPILLDIPAKELYYSMLCRCDQPLILLDRHITQHSRRNSELVEHILITRTVSRNGEMSLPLRALPVVFSTGATALSCSPFSMEVELSTKDLAECNWADWHDTLPSYLHVFWSYARDNQHRLKKLLENYVHRAIYEHSDLLHEDCARTLGILTALITFSEEFIACYTPQEQLSTSELEHFTAWLTSFMEHISWKAEEELEMAGRFTAIARTMLNRHVLTSAPLGTGGNSHVYYDETTLAFTRDAFRSVCARLDQSSPVVLRALEREGLLCGKKVNSSTAMTRIRVPDGEGGHRTLPVYRLTRSAFEQFGDPLMI